MKCPACLKGNLRSSIDTESPQKLTCDACSGSWLSYFHYWKWLKAHGAHLTEKPVDEGLEMPVVDSVKAKLCPACGHMMSSFKVGHGVSFHLDRCASCGGIWLDKFEWDVLKSRHLHDDIHFIFSSAWQSKIRKEEELKRYEKRVSEILGEKDYVKIREIKDWLSNNPKRNTVLAYLSDLDA